MTSNVPVKVSLVEKKTNLRKNPGSIRNLNKQLLDSLVDMDINIIQQRSVVSERQDIMFTPKKAGGVTEPVVNNNTKTYRK